MGMLCPSLPPAPVRPSLSAVPSQHSSSQAPIPQLHFGAAFAGERRIASKWAGGGPESAAADVADE